MNDLAAATAALARLREDMHRDRAWWATYDPVAFVWPCRAERRGAVVPWSRR